MATPRRIHVTTELDDGEDLARARFLGEIEARGLVQLGHDRFAGEVDAATASALGEPVLVRAKANGKTLEARVPPVGSAPPLPHYGWGPLRPRGAPRAGAPRPPRARR